MDLLWESSCLLVLANHEQIRVPMLTHLALSSGNLSLSKIVDVYGGPVGRPLNWLVFWTFFNCIIISSWLLQCPCYEFFVHQAEYRKFYLCHLSWLSGPFVALPILSLCFSHLPQEVFS
jgi:hypothetical protein